MDMVDTADIQSSPVLDSADLLDPNPDIWSLFCHYSDIYFDSALHACTVSWSSSRMTLCAGICKYSEGSCSIRLSEPILKFRPSRNLKKTLLHEMIHAYLWLTDNNKDHDDHGPGFKAKMQEINTSTVEDLQRPEGGYHISVYHNFVDEVDNYRRHQWMCLSCKDLIKRASNRAPSKSDCYRKVGQKSECDIAHCHWHNHQKRCGGEYTKVAEPEGYKDKRRKVLIIEDRKSSEAVEKKKLIVSEKSRYKAVHGPVIHKESSLEKFLIGRKESDKIDFNKEVEGLDDEFLENPVEKDNKLRKTKKRDFEADESEEQEPFAKMEKYGHLMSKKQRNGDLDSEEYTVIIGWKRWCAFEREEDENNVELLSNKRSQRKKAQNVHNLIEANAESLMTSSLHGSKSECINTNSMGVLRVSLTATDVVCKDLNLGVCQEIDGHISFQEDDLRAGFYSGINEVPMQQNNARKVDESDNNCMYIEDGSPSGVGEEISVDEAMQRRRLQKSNRVVDSGGPSAICPICQAVLSGNIEDADFNMRFNQHIDACIKI